MSLADRLESVINERQRPANYCPYKVMYDALNTNDQKTIDNAWTKGYSANTILIALRAEGIKSSNEAIRAHRKGMCKCPKS
jgi:hypothetical protein